ncbi:MAG TPA: hypothetical protein VGS80_00705 [Ktedonobacterales bacterium]|nr:hypothetical protein [Ktedonobacterales bacterium]
MRRRDILLGTLDLVVVVAAIGGVAYALHTRTQADGPAYPGPHAPVAVVCPGPTFSTTGQGEPAIRPRKDCTPSFTQQDVRAYLVHARGRLGFLRVTGQPTVTRVVFVTVGDLNRVGRQSVVGLIYPADMLVCDAELSGRFTLSNVSPPITESAISIVFDAHTGNQLVIVAGPLLG